MAAEGSVDSGRRRERISMRRITRMSRTTWWLYHFSQDMADLEELGERWRVVLEVEEGEGEGEGERERGGRWGYLAGCCC